MSAEEHVDTVVPLVLGVARLGENDLRGWWKGHALDRTGRYVLSGMFPRTWRSAALELDLAAAKLLQDELLGRATALHLFSDLLPFRRWANGWLAEQKTASDPDPMFDTLEDWTSELASGDILRWCGPVDALRGETLGSSLLLGRLSSLELADAGVLLQVAQALSAAYLDQVGQLRPPYFDLVR